MANKKNKPGKYAAKKKRSFGKGLLAVLFLIILAAALLLLLPGEEERPAEMPTEQTQAPSASPTAPLPLMTQPQQTTVNLGYGLYLTDIGAYTGMYMEDGSDEILSNILMLVVENDGGQDIQFARITLDVGEEQAVFELTTLPDTQRVVLLEKNRMAWDPEVDYDALLPKIENIAYFQEPVTIREDLLDIQIVDGALNVTNISGQAIPGTIAIYYKNAAEDIYYGGITYRVSIQGGLNAGELRQVMTNHASDTGSRILNVTVSE